jgi:hypothetical protein
MNHQTAERPVSALPLTPRQEMIWVEDSLHPGVPVNHVLTRLVVRGELDPQRFAAAFASVVAASDALRMEVLREGERWRAMFHGAAEPARLELADMTGSACPRSEADRRVAEMCQKPFAEGARLWRALLMRTALSEFQFVFDQHHSITDSQSCLLIHRAIERAYLGDDVSEARTYADVMMEQLAYGRSDAAATAAKFWTEHLAEIENPGRFYGRSWSQKGASTLRLSCVLSADTSASIRERRLDTPPSLVFAAAVAAWLARVTETSDVIFGVPLLNRSARFAVTPGLLMEVVPNRLRVELTDSFAAVLAKAKAEAGLVRPHRRQSLSVRDAQYEVLLNVHPTAPSGFAGMSATYELTTPLNVLPGDAFDADVSPWSRREALTVQVHQHGEGAPYEVSFDVNRRLFGIDLPGRALAHFVTLLEHAVADPDLAVGRTDILTPPERALLGLDSALLPAPPITVTRSFDCAVAGNGARTAVRHRGRDVTYVELSARVGAVAA